MVKIAHPVDHAALNFNPLAVTVYENAPGVIANGGNDNPGNLAAYSDELVRPSIHLKQYERNFATISREPTTLTDPLTGVKLSAYVLNSETATDDGVTAAVPTWLSSPGTNPGNQSLYSMLAAAQPNRRFVVVDTPGLGHSDTLPPQMLDGMAASGRFNVAGRVIARALLSSQLSPDHLIGNSSGGRYITGTASALPADTLKRVDVVDAPCAAVGKIAVAFFLREPKHRSAGRNVTTDPFAKIPTNEYRVKDFGFMGLVGLIAHRETRHQKASEGRAFGRGLQPFGADIQAALDAHQQLAVTIISPSASEVSPDLGEVRDMIAARTVGDDQRVRHLVIPNATHAMDDHHPLVFAAAVNHPYRSLGSAA